MQRYDRLKISLLRDFCFSAIEESRPGNKNVSTASITRAKRGTEPSVHKLLANYQTGFGYKFTPINGWYAKFMNAPRCIEA